MLDIRGMTPLLSVFDIEASLRFYCEILGFTLKTRANYWAWIERDGVDLMLNTLYDPDQQPEKPDLTRAATHEDVTLYFGCSDVDAAYEHFVAQGIPVEKPHVASYGMKQLYLKDPDDFGLCFQWKVQ